MKELLEANRNAPAFASASIDIAAPVETVWALMTRVEGWPDWNPDIKHAEVKGALRPGVVIRWKSGPGTIRSTLVDLKEPSRMSWTGRIFGIKAIHVWTLEALEERTRVQTEESWEGLIPRLAQGYSRRTLDSALASGLAYLKKEAERGLPGDGPAESESESAIG